MDWPIVLVLFFGALLALMALRVPVAIALVAVNMVGAFLLFGLDGASSRLILSAYSSLTTFVLVPIPLFILMGELLFRSGLAGEAMAVLDRMLKRIPGRMGMLAVAMGALFGVLSGSTLGTTAMLGSSLLPDMERQGFPRLIGMGAIIASGGLAMIIPPSALAVIWGAIAGVPVGPLLIAGLIPGLLMAVNYVVVIAIWSKLHARRSAAGVEAPIPVVTPSSAVQTGAPEVGTASSASTTRAGFYRYVAPLALVLFLAVGTIFLGIATPSEAAALGAVGSAVLVLLQGRWSSEVLRASLTGTSRVTGMILFILMGSTLYSQIMAFTGATSGAISWVTERDVHPLLLLFGIQVCVLVLGLFLDQISIMLVSLPFFMPIVADLGWDPIWFGVLMLINLQVALSTPPFGLGLFVMKGVAPKGTSLFDVYRAALPFVIADIVLMAILVSFPSIVTWLPRMVRS